jgi:hypothetical protein
MKKFGIGFLMLLGATLLPIAAMAQSSHVTKANIPFAFYAGKTEMPAGTYTLRVADNDRQLLLQNADGSVTTFLMGQLGDTSKALRPAFRFDQLGDAFFLRAATNSDQEFYLTKPKLEKQMEREGMIAQSKVITNGL